MNSLIKYPVFYDKKGQFIVDTDYNKICDIRGWGRFKYMENSRQIQDNVGEFIADAINEKLKSTLYLTTFKQLTKNFNSSPLDNLKRNKVKKE